jgi:hypothetical protein
MTEKYIAQLRADVTERLSKFEDPLIAELIAWIDPDALFAACEAVGMREGGHAWCLVTPDEIVEDSLKVLQKLLDNQ